jgi:hypothetical protein
MYSARAYSVQGRWKAFSPPFPSIDFEGVLEISDRGFVRGRLFDRGGHSAVIGMSKGDSLHFVKIYFKRGRFFYVDHEMQASKGGELHYSGTLEHRSAIENSAGSVEMDLKCLEKYSQARFAEVLFNPVHVMEGRLEEG